MENCQKFGLFGLSQSAPTMASTYYFLLQCALFVNKSIAKMIYPRLMYILLCPTDYAVYSDSTVGSASVPSNLQILPLIPTQITWGSWTKQLIRSLFTCTYVRCLLYKLMITNALVLQQNYSYKNANLKIVVWWGHHLLIVISPNIRQMG